MLGGGLRQVGILAAAGIVAINKMAPRLHEDHERVQQLAAGISTLSAHGITLLSANTNILYFRLESNAKVTATELKEKMLARFAHRHNFGISNIYWISLNYRGVLMGGADKAGRIRLVTHYWITKTSAEEYLKHLSDILQGK